MFRGRFSKMIAVLLILTAVFLSTSFSSHAANTQTMKSSYSNIEFARSEQPAIPSTDRSYDAIDIARYKQPSCGDTCTADGCMYPLPNGIFTH